VTTWNRRVSVASQRQRPTISKDEVLREAVALGVLPDDQAALLALARVAAERPGYRTTLVVRSGARPDDEVLFEVTNTPDGAVARRAGSAGAASPAPAVALPADVVPESDESTSGPDVIGILTDSLVQTPDLVAVFASIGHEAIWANDAFVTLVPIRESDKIWLVELLDEWSKGHYEVKVLPALVKYGRWRGRLTLLTGASEPLPVSAVIVAHRDVRGEIEAVSMVARDLTELRLVEERVAASETRFAALVEHASDIIAVLSPDGLIQYASPATTRILGHDDDALTGTNLLELVHPDDLPGELLDLAKPDEQGIGSAVELRLGAADGSWRYLEIVVTDLMSNPAIGGLVLNARDVTERVEATHTLATKAFTDQLTGMPNRMRLLDRLAQALHDSASVGAVDGSVVVLLVDLDQFKALNDGFGKEIADSALCEIGQRLTEAAGRSATVARLRSDEFAIVIRDVDDRADGPRAAGRLLAAVRDPMVIEGLHVEVTASVGVAFSRPGDEPETLLRDADHAMTLAKEAGGDRAEFFSDELAIKTTRRRDVEQRLRQVIDDESFVVHYQPILDIETDAVVGAEALLRVHDDEGSLLSPAEFIDAAESSGLITRLGSQMLQVTCAQLAAWTQQTGGAREISVNVSPRQLADRDLPQHVHTALNSAGVAPDRLWLEITESILIGHQATVDASISYLRALGVKIGLDEFGTGQSSLGYLKRFPVDFVKIDRSLVAGLGSSEQDTAIVRATIELAHNLGLTVVAVGVETDEQLDMLQLLGCDRAQGYLFAPPVAADQFVKTVSDAS
jgi:diguanylate cyclase (GGDEF)-like protein/PAS domain S-box-containing protein